MPEGKVDDFGITFDIDLDLALLCAGMADKLGLCKILVGGSRKQLQQWSMASVPILSYPDLEMVSSRGCAVKIEERQPSIGIEVVSHKWVLDAPLVQISGGHTSEITLHYGEEIPARLGELYHVASLQLFGTQITVTKVSQQSIGNLEVDCVTDPDLFEETFATGVPSCSSETTACVAEALAWLVCSSAAACQIC